MPITKATNTYSEYVIISAFLLQQWLRERASMLCLCVHCVVISEGSYLKMRLQILPSTYPEEQVCFAER